jgi:hypothetical protein
MATRIATEDDLSRHPVHLRHHGRAKGAMLNQRNCVECGDSLAKRWRITRDDVPTSTRCPIFPTRTASSWRSTSRSLAGFVGHPAAPGSTAAQIVQLFSAAPTVLMGVPTLYNNAPLSSNRGSTRPSTSRQCGSSSRGRRPPLCRDAHDVGARAPGTRSSSAYGMTETNMKTPSNP